MPLGSTVVARIRSLLQENGVVSLGRLEGAALHIERIVDEEHAKLNASKERTRAKRAGFTPPTPEDVTAYSLEVGYPLDGQGFCDHYQTKNWKVGGSTKMADWKAAVRKWKASGWSLDGVSGRQKKREYEAQSIQEIFGWREFLLEREAQGLFKEPMPEAWEGVSLRIRDMIAGRAKYAAQLAEFARQNAHDWQERLDRLRRERADG